MRAFGRVLRCVRAGVLAFGADCARSLSVSSSLSSANKLQLTRLRGTIERQAQAAADNETAKQELETRLKQLFLRGVAAMNLEAVHIFNEEHAHTSSSSSSSSGPAAGRR